ncbi:unnamed protein product [Didymodactylos carnosus]|uniref:Uncharacterized protein n=1 Tax=Didymodactylos carnosus TaxID=1234261 RepID=A0A815WRM9_9BILA|nr:unnamed protein product [Didymodactylos carnosus]CAF4407449.1 unnamed protein product [Didymodactylos carnosus]
MIDELFNRLRTQFITGSIIEGQVYNKYQCDDIPDIDLMINYRAINSQDELLPTSSIPGYVYVKWNSTTLGTLPYEIHPQQNIRCINGFELKSGHIYASTSDPLQYQTSTDVDSASVRVTTNLRDLTVIAKEFDVVLRRAESFQRDHTQKGKEFLILFTNVLNIFSYIRPSMLMSVPEADSFLNVEVIENMLHLCSPAFGYQLSDDNKSKSEALINYYLKYKHTIDKKISIQNANAGFQIFHNDLDYVPSLKLNF